MGRIALKWMKWGTLALLTSCASQPLRSQKTLSYSTDLFVPISFLENKSHLAMNVHYPPVQKIKQILDAELPEPLKNRNEAHITVLNPLEYDQLKAFLPMEKINELARTHQIQQSSFKTICLGKGRLQIDGREESNYFIVVESADLLQLRTQIKEAFVAAGGTVNAFNENLYFPHITVGFTKRDLHYEDGILKDKTSCWKDLSIN